MNGPTLEALRKIRAALHEAGWDDPGPPGPMTDARLEHLRDASARFLRPDDLKVIQAVVAERRPMAEVAAELHHSPDDLTRRLAEALEGLAAFARVASPFPG